MQVRIIHEIEDAREQGKVIVFTNGCFDLLHVGHVRFLHACKSLGDVLVVGLNSDVSVQKQEKGFHRPINIEQHRKEVLLGLESVDYVLFFDGLGPSDVVKDVRPDIMVKGDDWRGKTIIGSDEVISSGGRLEFLPLTKGMSTTALIEKIQHLSR